MTESTAAAPVTSRSGGPDRTARFYGVTVAQFYAALFLVYGVHVPFLPIWLDSRGLDSAEVALVTSVPFLARLLVTPATAIIADSLGNHRLVIIVLAWIAVTAVAGLGLVSGFMGILILSVPFALASMSIMPLLETVAIQGVKHHQLDYGRMRLWGSLTFIAVGLAGGQLIDVYGPEAAYWLLLGAVGLTVLSAHLLPPPEHGEESVRHVQVRDLLGPEIRALAGSWLFVSFIVATSFCQAAHAMFYTFGTLHWQSQGISASAAGGLWAIGVLAEVVLFAVAGSWLRGWRAETLMLAGALGSVVRWTVMGFDPPFAALIGLQLFHALSYGAIHLGAIQFIARIAPPGLSGTVQALYATFAIGAMLGVMTMASGPLYDAFAGQAYLAMAGVSAIGLLAALNVRRLATRPTDAHQPAG